MLLRPGKLPPRCPSDVAIAASVPTRCCCVPGSYRIREALMLLGGVRPGRPGSAFGVVAGAGAPDAQRHGNADPLPLLRGRGRNSADPGPSQEQRIGVSAVVNRVRTTTALTPGRRRSSNCGSALLLLPGLLQQR